VVTAGLLGIGLALICTWVFVGTTARTDGRSGGTSRISRRSGWWLAAGFALSVVSVSLLVAAVVRLWL
jgi:hypothetical protein